MRPFITLSLLLALAPTAPLAAQYVQPLPQTTPPGDADALADQMRVLAGNPSDLNALVRAGELALRLEDSTAAASFFARAERIDPRNARVKAGTGVLLVQAERPGEALRRFAEAESYGARPATFAADRGLAYDLIGEQERAQRDYRLALKGGPNDETIRRYALSLGISGKREEALTLLDPLLRKSDRGAWRARAFILAMSGNRVDAEKIATTMMPAGMSQGLQPFFDRLPSLSPVDRAFAVHFGEIRPSMQRIADARMVPPLPPLGVDPDARELALAAQAREKPMRAAEEKPLKPGKRKRGRREPVELAVQAAAPPVALALPTPPAYVDPSAATRSSVVPGAPNYYVQQLPGTRAPAPAYSPAYTQAYNSVPQPYRAPVASVPFTRAPTPAPQTQAVPAYQPAQRVSGRVMPLAPLQPAPPSASAVPVRAPVRPWAPASPLAETSTRVVPMVQPAPVAPIATPPVALPIRPAPTPQVAPAVPVTPTAVVPAATVTRVGQTQGAAAVPLAPRTPAVAPVPTLASGGIFPAAPVAVPPTATGTSIASAPTQVASAPPNAVKANGEDAILSGIISKIGVPGTELGVALVAPEPRPVPVISRPVEPVRPAPVVDVVKSPVKPIAEARHKPRPEDDSEPASKRGADSRKTSDAKSSGRKADAEDITEAKKPGARKSSDKKGGDGRKTADSENDIADDGKKPTGKKAASKKGVASEDSAGAKATDGKKHADKKAGATRKTEDADEDADTRSADGRKRTDKKGADDKKSADAKKKEPKSAEPSRVWVQVSGGANESDLPKQWNKLRADQPGMFKGRSGYATPLRATNRILTGPFASDAEAQAYVNKLAKQGISGFLFKSEAGQKVSKLPGK